MSLQNIMSQLTELRRSQGLTQEELGRRAGMTQANVARIENASTEPTWKQVTRLAQALGQEATPILQPSDRLQAYLPLEQVFGARQLGRSDSRSRDLSDLPRTLPMGPNGAASHPNLVGIEGEVGSGKTVALASIVHELHSQANILLVDPRGEVIQLLQTMRSESLFDLNVNRVYASNLQGSDRNIALLGRDVTVKTVRTAADALPDNGRPNVMLCDDAIDVGGSRTSLVMTELRMCRNLDWIVATTLGNQDSGTARFDLKFSLKSRRGATGDQKVLVEDKAGMLGLTRQVKAHYLPSGPAMDGPCSVQIDISGTDAPELWRARAVAMLQVAGREVYVCSSNGELDELQERLQEGGCRQEAPAVVVYDPEQAIDPARILYLARTARSFNLSVVVLRELDPEGSLAKFESFTWSESSSVR